MTIPPFLEEYTPLKQFIQKNHGFTVVFSRFYTSKGKAP